jgi:hypothetical protein
MKKTIPTDVYDKEGNLTKIEFSDGEGEHIVDVVWDETDAQTSENRESFRKWAYTMLEQKGYVLYN